MTNLFHFIDSLEKGGAETYLLSTIRLISNSDRRIKQFLIVLKGNLSSFNFEIPEGIDVILLSLNPLNFIFKLIYLKIFISRYNNVIFHSHLLHSIFISRILCTKNIKLISTYHSVFYEYNLNKYELYMDRFSYKSRFHTIYVSEAVKTSILDYVNIHGNSMVLYNYADPIKFYKSYSYVGEKSHLRLLMVGNLNNAKNYFFILEAFRNLKFLKVTLDICGYGSLKDEMLSYINENSLSINLLGSVDIDSKFHSKYDLFIMSSKFEGMPLALVEAMTSGLPVITSDISVFREICGSDALYFDNNSINSFVSLLLNLFSNQTKLGSLSSNSIARSSNFHYFAHINSLLSLYKN